MPRRFKDLTVRSEAELDKAVIDMEARIAQETMTLNEEKALMASVRKLRYVDAPSVSVHAERCVHQHHCR